MRNYIFIILISLFLIPAASADGMAVKGFEERWALQPETSQLAAIHYENGYENLLLSVTLEKDAAADRTVWIVPVPQPPGRVEIDVVSGFPRFGGKNLDRVVGDTAGNAAMISAAWGTFPASLPLWVFANYGFFTFQKSQEAVYDHSGVIVHERIEKMGVVTELVTARDGASIRDYLAANGITLPEGAVGILDEYTGKDYSFVISRAGTTTVDETATGEDGGSRSDPDYDILAVFVRFPAESIYFPLQPTSVYGGRVIPVVIDITGFVTPLPYEEIRPGTEVSYFIDDFYWSSYYSEDLAGFFNHKRGAGPFRYTRVRIDAPSAFFTRDLFIDPKTPPAVQVKEVLINTMVIWAVPLYILVSVLASLGAGIVVFGRGIVRTKTLAANGLWNCATMIGFVYGTAINLKAGEITRRQKVAYFILFYAVFTGVFALLGALASPVVARGLGNLANFIGILPVIGFMYGMYIFSRDPVLAIVLFTINAGVYGALWLAVKRYL